MFISRIPLNKVRYGARQLIGSPYKLHAAVEAAFPPDAVRRTDDGRILWRLDSLGQDGGVWLYVVSPQKPDFTHIVEQAGWPMHAEWETKNYDALLDRVTKGQQWHFKLRANPARNAGVDKGRRHRSDGIVVMSQPANNCSGWLIVPWFTASEFLKTNMGSPMWWSKSGIRNSSSVVARRLPWSQLFSKDVWK